MPKKIGRNDPCPCGSGKKYKSCCLKKKKQQSEAVPWPTFPEDLVIGDLLRSSKEFAAFYEVESKKITEPVHWAKDLSLPPGIGYRCTRLPKGTQVIRLRRIPAMLEDALKIAHELQHLVLYSEGFPVTGATAQYEAISSSLNSMVHDPLVNSRLQAYGFDLREDCETELQEALCQLENRPRSPSGHLDRIHWIFNYVGKILDWELIDAGSSEGNEFQLWFDARYPDIAMEAKDLLTLVKEIGYETPEKQATLLRKIIQRHKLRKIVFL